MAHKFKAFVVAAAVLIGSVLMVQPASAQFNRPNQQQEIRIEPPVPRRADKPPVLWNYLLLIIIVGTAFAANMMPSKRGHQD
jgi:hypothetical protein